MWSSSSRPPRITKPFLGSLIPSRAPPGSLRRSRIVMRSPGTWASRTRKAAPASEASPAPTNQARLRSAPSGLRGLANAS